MNVSRTDAAAALAEMERTTDRSRVLRGYRITGPILMLWGVIWVLGYGGMGVLPVQLWDAVWLVLDVLGLVLTILTLRRRAAAIANRWRTGLIFLAALVFVGAILTLFRVTSPGVYLVFPALICGFIYVILGVCFMMRLAWVGAAMFLATLVGFYFVQPWLAFWMAGVGGGGLLLGGLWLGRA
jgi:hypothetical protein